MILFCHRRNAEELLLKLLRTIFQDHDELHTEDSSPKLILLIDMEGDISLTTSDIPGLVDKMETALPGIFPDDDSPLTHNCGGAESGIAIHSFKEEIEHGTNIPHLLEHIILFMLSKSSNHSRGYCGQRSIDIEQGILTHFYIVINYHAKLECIVAVDLAMQLVASWMKGQTVVIDPDVMLTGIQSRLEPMVSPLLPLSGTPFIAS